MKEFLYYWIFTFLPKNKIVNKKVKYSMMKTE